MNHQYTALALFPGQRNILCLTHDLTLVHRVCVITSQGAV